MQRQTIRVASLLRSQHSLSFDQTRTLYADVKNNKVNAALSQLNQAMRDEGTAQAVRARDRGFVKPCQQRRLELKESQTRLQSKRFKFHMYWVMRRRARGF